MRSEHTVCRVRSQTLCRIRLLPGPWVLRFLDRNLELRVKERLTVRTTLLGRGDAAYATLDRGGTCEGLPTFIGGDKSCTAAANRQPGVRGGSRANWSSANRAILGEVRIFQSRSIKRLKIPKVRFAGKWSLSRRLSIFTFCFRYRYAALPNKYAEICADKRLQPRVSPFLFPGSQILSRDKMGFQRLLNQWYGSPKQSWRLVYR